MTWNGATGGRVRAWLGNLALLGGSVALVLGGLELAARWQLSRPARGKGVGGNAHMRFHPLLGWEKLPGAVDEYERDDFHVIERINSHGLRDIERDYPARGAYRVLALGDSFVEGFTVDLEQTVTRQLEERLRRQGCPVEVVNGATAGYGTDQEWLFFREEGRRYEPRLVLLFFFYNDVDSNVRTNYFGVPKPLVVSGPQGLQPVNTPLKPPAAKPAADDERQAAQEFVRGSALLTWIQGRLLHGAPRVHRWLAERGLWARVRPVPAPANYGVYFVPAGPRVRKAWGRTEELLGALRDEVAASGARLALVYVPAKFEVRARDADLTSASYKLKGSRWQGDAVRSRLGQAADRLGLPLLDLTPSLQRAESFWRGTTYLEHDAHWTRRGHAAAAEAVAGWLRAQTGLVDCSAPAH